MRSIGPQPAGRPSPSGFGLAAPPGFGLAAPAGLDLAASRWQLPAAYRHPLLTHASRGDDRQWGGRPGAAGGRAPRPAMRIAVATEKDLPVVLGLIAEAAAWLRSKDTDQWAKPWPDEKERDARVLRGLKGGKTWIVWDGTTPAATVTMATRHNPRVWSGPTCECDLSERAVYVHRLITARRYAGLGLGARLIDWAGLRAGRDYGAKWIRIDVWTDNAALHSYYLNRGFKPCGSCADDGYPSGALFQKEVSAIERPLVPLFE